MTWAPGRDVLERLVAEGQLTHISGSAADGTQLIASASALLLSATREQSANPEAAYVLGYDAARKACTALIAQQGLRTRTTGHHVTVEQVVRAQFGGPFHDFGALRRRRTEIEYPQRPGDEITADEVAVSLAIVESIVEVATKILPDLDIFRVGR